MFFVTNLKGQTKVVGECMLQFHVAQQQGAEWLPLGDKKVFIKGNQCKTVFTSPHLSQTLIFNTQDETGIVLKDIGESHFLQEVKYPPSNVSTLVSMKHILIDSVLKIQGYVCNRVQLQWSDGSLYDIYFTTEIIPSVTTFETAFKDVPGLILSYTITALNGSVIKYELTGLDLNPITLNQFEVNKSLYQIID